MRITAMSDIHGDLPKINETDLLIIAGDWSPLEIQRDSLYMKEWLLEFFFPYLRDVPADKVIFIAGNHDFVCDDEYNFYDTLFLSKKSFKKNFLRTYLSKVGIKDKVKYLEDSYTIYNGVKIYGCPFVFGCDGWAFSNAQLRMSYQAIPKCDILVTHQPPKYNDIGSITVKQCGCLLKRDFGSTDLTDRIKQIKPSLVFCGHIHEGDHSKQTIVYDDGKETALYNCALKDENYKLKFKPVEVEYVKSENK